MNAFANDLCIGLSRAPRRVSPKWLYDERGSELFEEICDSPEYYPTRTEIGLLRRCGREIAEQIGAGATIVDFGAGSLRKAQALVEWLVKPAAYVPIDISGSFLEQAADSTQGRLASMPLHPVVADFTDPASVPELGVDDRRVGFYPGSSIGNFEPAEVAAWLEGVRGRLGGGLLVGVDLIKSPERLYAAYNDEGGVTAAFNLNLLVRANREAGADFDPSQWAHTAFYNPPQHRVEMHLVSMCDQDVHIGERSFHFTQGDSIHTECSYKYTVERFHALARDAGWLAEQVWVDPEGLFSLHWLVPRVE